MGSRVRPTRIFCVNCNICVNHLRRFVALALDTKVSAIICSWAHPQIVLENDYVCNKCKDLAIAAANRNLQSEVSGSDGAIRNFRRHKSVCLLCGCSILQRQSDKVFRENPNEMQQCIINMIEIKITPREISSSDRVCHACWLRAKREVLRSKHHAEKRALQDLTKLNIDVQHDEDQLSPSTVPATVENSQNRIVLPDYRRAANSTHRCAFPNCKSTSFHNISDKLRATVLHNHNFYLPKLARVCSEHLTNNLWSTLYSSENSIQTFSVEHIQHVFSFVNICYPSVD